MNRRHLLLAAPALGLGACAAPAPAQTGAPLAHAPGDCPPGAPFVPQGEARWRAASTTAQALTGDVTISGGTVTLARGGRIALTPATGACAATFRAAGEAVATPAPLCGPLELGWASAGLTEDGALWLDLYAAGPAPEQFCLRLGFVRA